MQPVVRRDLGDAGAVFTAPQLRPLTQDQRLRFIQRNYVVFGQETQRIPTVS